MKFIINAWNWFDGKKRGIAAGLAAILAALQSLQAAGIVIPHEADAVKGITWAAGAIGTLGIAHAAFKANQAQTNLDGGTNTDPQPTMKPNP